MQVLGQLDQGLSYNHCDGMVLEFVEGGCTSVEWLETVRDPTARLHASCKVLRDVAAALAHLAGEKRSSMLVSSRLICTHQRKANGCYQVLLHRDIWSENVLVCSGGECSKLADFGTAVIADSRSTEGFPAKSHITMDENCPLQLSRMPREFHCFAEYAVSSDVFQFGLLIWELLFLTTPYQHSDDFYSTQEDPTALWTALGKAGMAGELSHPIPAPRLSKAIPTNCMSVAAELEPLFERCLSSKQADRPDIHEICEILQSITVIVCSISQNSELLGSDSESNGLVSDGFDRTRPLSQMPGFLGQMQDSVS